MPDINTVVVTPTVSVVAVNSSVPGSYDSVARLGLDMFSVAEYGAVGDGSTDDTTAFTSALAAASANGGGTVLVPTGTFKITATLVLPANTKLTGQGPQRSILKRYFNGTMLTATGVSDIEVSHLSLDGNAPTYTGKGIVLSGTSLRPVFDNLWSISMGGVTDTHLEFGADAGQLAHVSRCNFRPGGGTLDYRAIHTNGPDTSGAFRTFSQVQVGNGYIDISGAADTQFADCGAMRWESSSATSICLIVGCIWANLGGAMTLHGVAMNVIGCRFAGSATLSASYRGSFIGNFFSDTSYTLTDNTTLSGTLVLQQLLSDDIVRMYGDFQLQKKLRFGLAVGSIIPGATSLHIRNNADSASNLTINDNGTASFQQGKVTQGANALAQEAGFTANAAAGQAKVYEMFTAGLRRWRMMSEGDAESGGNAGSTFKIIAYDDAGAQVDEPLTIARGAGGRMTITRPIAASYGVTAPVGADVGDANATLTVGTSAPIQRWATTLTQNRTVTLSTTGAVNGDRFRIVRSGLGAFTLDVGGLKTIPSGTAAFVDVSYSGSAWILSGYGTL